MTPDLVKMRGFDFRFATDAELEARIAEICDVLRHGAARHFDRRMWDALDFERECCGHELFDRSRMSAHEILRRQAETAILAGVSR